MPRDADSRRSFSWSFAAALALLGAACSAAPSAAPVAIIAPPVPPASSSSAAAEEEPPALGAPVLVPQLFRRSIQTAALSPDGRLVMLPTEQGMQLVDAETGEVRGRHSGCVHRFAFAARGAIGVLTSCEGHKAWLWDLERDVERTMEVRSTNVYVPPGGPYAVFVDERGGELVATTTGETWTLEMPSGIKAKTVFASYEGTVALLSKDHAYFFARGARRPVDAEIGWTVHAGSFSRSGKRFAALQEAGMARVIDPASGATVAEQRVCEGKGKDVEWTEAEDHLVVSCAGKKAEVYLASPTLARERTLVEDPHDHFSIWTRKDLVATAHGRLGASVFDLAGKTILQIQDARKLDVDAKLERVLSWSTSVDKVAVHDVARGKLPFAVHPNVDVLKLAAAGSGALDLGKDRIFDTAKHTVSVEGELSADGRVVLSVTGQGQVAVFKERATGNGRTQPALDIGASPEHWLTPRGGFVLLPRLPNNEDDRTPLALEVIPAKAKSHRIRLDSLAWSTVVSPADDTVAIAVDTHEAQGHRCDGPHPECMGVDVFDLARGTRKAKIRPKLGLTERREIAFSSDGRRLVVDGAVYDARTGKQAWTLPEGSRVLGFSAKRDLVFVAKGTDALVLAVASGQEVGTIPGLSAIHGASDDGSLLIASKDGELALVDVSSLAVRRLSFGAPEGVAYVTNDGAFVWFGDSPHVVAFRAADGRSLRWLPDGPPISDQGVFDPKDLPKLPVAVRRGPNVAKSPMAPLSSVVATHGHTGLVDDFFAGRPIAPR
jgi:hypothetical protein